LLLLDLLTSKLSSCLLKMWCLLGKFKEKKELKCLTISKQLLNQLITSLFCSNQGPEDSTFKAYMATRMERCLKSMEMTQLQKSLQKKWLKNTINMTQEPRSSSWSREWKLFICRQTLLHCFLSILRKDQFLFN